MRRPTLESARLKLERAEELLNEIRAGYDELNTRTNAQAITGVPDERIRMAPVQIELGPDGAWYVVRCLSIEQPPKRWGLLAGDAVHNTRSALDHLASRLVELEGNEPTDRTAFPIRRHVPSNAQQRRGFNDLIEGMNETHRKQIRRLQPYAMRGTPEAGNLLALATLDNLDKHKMLMPQIAVIGPEGPIPPIFEAAELERVHYRLNEGALLHPGVEVLRWRLLGGERNPVTTLHLGMHVRATYGDPSTGLRELRQIRAYIVGIIESFAPDFDA